jgi:tetratricopeptide (TPR) repeat protein
MPVVFLLVIWHDREKLRDFRLWITGLIFSLVMLVPTVPTEAFLLGLIVWLAFTLITSITSRFASGWALPLALTVAATVGYSSQLYIPIRSSLDPVIDENDPDTWPKFKRFLERRQYGETGMVERSFSRRGKLANQIGTQERMGFWRFFREQYSTPRLWFVPVFAGLFGIVMLIRHRPREGLSLSLLLLLATVGLVWYMNFGDGTVPGQRLEVRDRDYFFLPGFVLFALFIGLGAAVLTAWMVGKLQAGVIGRMKPAAYVSGVIFLVLPVLSLASNYQRNNRSGNWVAYDFAYNLLNTCDQNALLFTNGDNDTFPLWFMQEVEGVRKDVRNLNFSLINIDWYILQQRDKFKVPITLTDAQILSLRPVVYEGRQYRIQDQMLDHILDANAWKYPLNFSNTVSPENRIYRSRSLDNHLILLGLATRLIPQEGTQMVDLESLRKNLYQIYKYRTRLDPQPKLDETSRRMLSYDLSCYFSLADTLARAGRFDEAVKVTYDGKKFAPQDWRIYAMLIQLYAKAGREAEAEKIIQDAPQNVEKERLYFNLGFTFKTLGHQNQYEQYMRKILQSNPGYQEAYKELFASYYNQKRRVDLLDLLQDWTSHNPQDRRAYSLLQAVQNPNFNFPDSAAIRQAFGQ